MISRRHVPAGPRHRDRATRSGACAGDAHADRASAEFRSGQTDSTLYSSSAAPRQAIDFRCMVQNLLRGLPAVTTNPMWRTPCLSS